MEIGYENQVCLEAALSSAGSLGSYYALKGILLGDLLTGLSVSIVQLLEQHMNLNLPDSVYVNIHYVINQMFAFNFQLEIS